MEVNGQETKTNKKKASPTPSIQTTLDNIITIPTFVDRRPKPPLTRQTTLFNSFFL